MLGILVASWVSLASADCRRVIGGPERFGRPVIQTQDVSSILSEPENGDQYIFVLYFYTDQRVLIGNMLCPQIDYSGRTSSGAEGVSSLSLEDFKLSKRMILKQEIEITSQGYFGEPRTGLILISATRTQMKNLIASRPPYLGSVLLGIKDRPRYPR